MRLLGPPSLVITVLPRPFPRVSSHPAVPGWPHLYGQEGPAERRGLLLPGGAHGGLALVGESGRSWAAGPAGWGNRRATPQGQGSVAAQGSGPAAMCGRTVSARLAGVLSWAGGPQAHDPLTTPPRSSLAGTPTVMLR